MSKTCSKLISSRKKENSPMAVHVFQMCQHFIGTLWTDSWRSGVGHLAKNSRVVAGESSLHENRYTSDHVSLRSMLIRTHGEPKLENDCLLPRHFQTACQRMKKSTFDTCFRVVRVEHQLNQWTTSKKSLHISHVLSGTVLIPATTLLTPKDIKQRLLKSSSRCVITDSSNADKVDEVGDFCCNRKHHVLPFHEERSALCSRST